MKKTSILTGVLEHFTQAHRSSRTRHYRRARRNGKHTYSDLGRKSPNDSKWGGGTRSEQVSCRWMSARRFAPLGFVQTRRELPLKLRLNKKKQMFFFFKTAGPICETCERVPCSCRDRGEDIVCWGGGEVVAQGVGVNYANKCSDTNLDEDSVKEELAEGGIVRMMAAAAAAVVGGASPPHLHLPPHSLLFTLRQQLILFAPLFFFFFF